jgi:hypothetical protein
LGAALVTKKKIVRDKRSSLLRRSISDEEKIVRDKRSNLFRGSVSGEEEHSQDSGTNAPAYFGVTLMTEKIVRGKRFGVSLMTKKNKVRDQRSSLLRGGISDVEKNILYHRYLSSNLYQ